jgi:hypothetical protein
MTDPHTVIVTQRVTAQELHDTHWPLPVFVWDGVEAGEPDTGIHTSMARWVSNTIPEGDQIIIKFRDDDVPDRAINMHEPIEVHMIMPGVDMPGQ